MGNSKAAAGCHLPTAGEKLPASGQENGILSRVRGDYVAQALQSLPAPTRDGAAEHQVVLDAGPVGRIRLFIARKLVRHNKHSHYYWSAYRAEFVSGAE